MENNPIEICLSTEDQVKIDLDQTIFDLNSKISDLESKADTLDLIISASSGLICSMLDVLWVGEFDLVKGREMASNKIDEFVKWIAKKTGCQKDDLLSCVKHLEDAYRIPSDGNTSDFGGGLQHHLRDFSHHPNIIGLFFSLLTQFSGISYGTDTNGVLVSYPIPASSQEFIGENTISKIVNGTIIWFFHLVSDLAGSKDSIRRNGGIGGGTGIPGPILSLAKELSTLPFFRNIKKDDTTISQFISKLFNGTQLAEHEKNGTIVKGTELRIDFRGELGIAIELGKQSLPVIANECFVRVFYFFRRLAIEIKKKSITTLSTFRFIDWQAVKPTNSPTLSRMLLVSSGVFTTVDIAEAVISQKYWLSINYVGVARFAIAIGSDVSWALKRYNMVKIKQMFETIKQNTFLYEDNDSYARLGEEMNTSKVGLTLEQTIVLYNMEYYKVLNDIEVAKSVAETEKIRKLKAEWLSEWKEYMEKGFPGFTRIPNAVLTWYSYDELQSLILRLNPHETWFKLAILEATLFTPYYPLGTEKNKNGKEIPSKKYAKLTNPLTGFNQAAGDKYIEEFFSSKYCASGFVNRLRKCHSKVLKELNEVLKTTITSIAVGAGVVIVVIATAGVLAPHIAVALVGTKFAGLSGAALTNACLAYLGGGAIAAGGAGMAGGTAAIVGGGALLGVGAGVGAGSVTQIISLGGKQATIAQSAKLIVSVREIFLNAEKDVDYSTTVYEQYVQSIMTIEKDLVELRLRAETAPKEEKVKLNKEIKNAEESVKAMKIAMKSMNRFISSYKVGMGEIE